MDTLLDFKSPQLLLPISFAPYPLLIIGEATLQRESPIASTHRRSLRKHFDPLPPHILRQPAHHYVDLTLGPFALATDLLIGAKGIHFQLWPYITPSI